MNETVKKIFDLFKNNQILSILESNNNYIVSVCDKSADVNDTAESIYAVDKRTFEISEFSYFNNPDEYAEASNNVLYKQVTDDELTHWGIKGMRWGVRRYQRKDGSLTPAGKKRLETENASLKKEAQVLKNRKSTQAKFDRLAAKRKAIEDEKKALDDADKTRLGKKGKNSDSGETAQTTKSLKDMTDDELLKAVNRGRLEDAYRQLYPEPPVKKSLMKKMVDDVVAPAALNSGKKFLESALTKAGENLLKGKVDPNSIEALTAIRDKLKIQTEIEEYRNGGKYNWDNLLKKQQYGNQAEDRSSQMRGYKNAADEAQAKRDANEASRKSRADEAARVANESKSREYYNSVYSKNTGEKTAVNSSGSSAIQKLLGAGKPTTDLVTKSNVSSGKTHISGLLEGSSGTRKSNEIGYIDENGRFHAY